jgi:hypothetical protein
MGPRNSTAQRPGAEGLPRRLAREIKVHTTAYQADRRARKAARGATVIVGPWCSEVGFELLYWIPFVRRLLHNQGVSRDRVVVVSRGGVASWYGDLSSRYYDLFDWLSAEDLQEERLRRIRVGGGEKQMSISDFDRAALERVRDVAGAPNATVLHPSMMYRRYRAVWMRRRSPNFVTRELAFAPLAVEPQPPAGLTEGGYIAVKAYFSSSLPDSSENHAAVRDVLERLSAHSPVVMLGGGRTYDDHEHPELADLDLVRPSPAAGATATHLDEQTRIVSGARMLVATYGGFSYLGPLVGTPTCAFYSHDVFNHVHLEILRAMERTLAGGSVATSAYMPLDVDHLSLLDQLVAAPSRSAADVRS